MRDAVEEVEGPDEDRAQEQPDDDGRELARRPQADVRGDVEACPYWRAALG